VAPTNPPGFIAGPSVVDADALLDWLEAQAQPSGRLVRLPVRVQFDDAYRLGIVGGAVCTTDPAPADALPLKLDDTAMSSSLLDLLRDRVAEGADSGLFWLEGTWGAVVSVGGMPALDLPGFELPGFEAAPERHPFAVRRVVGPVGGEDPPVAYLEAR
jgi:hypothetical protein